MSAADPTLRFSDRVEQYVLYRPDYPDGVLDILRSATGLTPEAVVADIGSGTGISTDLFLRNGNRVFAVEPNAEMRAAAETRFSESPLFRSVPATAEATTLPDASVDYVVAGQAFHWFDAERARAEFQRILKPDGWVVLMWNSRRLDRTRFLRDYEALLQKFGTDYDRVRHENIDTAAIGAFFGAGGFRYRSLDHAQIFDREGLRGRLLSSSYVPGEGQPGRAEMLEELDRIFDRSQVDSRVAYEYDTEIYFGRLT
jgi:SAM-dependent methyltransferase